MMKLVLVLVLVAFAKAPYCLMDGYMPATLRQAIITLLFKKDDPELLKNWRPISLLNVDYKILTKVLVNRIKPLMSTVVNSDQCCSVLGGQANIMLRFYETLLTISKYMKTKLVPSYP